MITYRDCIADQLKNDKISKRKAKEALDRYDNIRGELLSRSEHCCHYKQQRRCERSSSERDRRTLSLPSHQPFAS